MKAVTYKEYGTADVLCLEEVPKPNPASDEVLVNVKAASVNDWEAGLFTGKPLFMRYFLGWRKPKSKYQRLGCDFSGIVESVGVNVTAFREGDEVYGDLCECGFGSFAKYITAPIKALTLKSPEMSFEQAAAIPQAGMLAKQGLYDIAPIKSGQRILINGAGGGVGTIGIQIAKQLDVEVTGVDSAGKLAMMKSLGFDYVIDYEKEDFAKNGEVYDLILDNKMSRSPFTYAKSLNPGGAYVATGGSMIRVVQMIIVAKWIQLTQNKITRIVSLKANRDLLYFNELFASGKFEPVIDGTYKLDTAIDAIRYYLTAKQRGKVVISVD